MFVTVIAKIMFYDEFLLINHFYFVCLFEIFALPGRVLPRGLYVALVFAKSG